MLQTQDLTLAYGAETVVSSIDLDFETGQITTLIGPNGCGKSTVLRALARLHKARSGAVLLEGADIHRLPTRMVAQKLGYLAQHSDVPQALTVLELVRRGRFPHRQAWQPLGPEDEAAVGRALAACGLVEWADKVVDELSGGQKQRAWIALTLAQESPLILLDEPTTFLDTEHQNEVLELVARLHREGRTFVLVLHDWAQVSRISHRVVAVKRGQICAQGTPREVLTPESLQQLYGVPFDEAGPVPGVNLALSAYGAPAPVLRAEGVVAGYNGLAVVGPFSATWGPGGLHVLMGRNGCGKSTLLHTLAGLHPRLAGSIRLDAKPLESYSARALAARRAFVQQDTPLPAGFTVRELLALGGYHRKGLWKRRSHAEEAVVASALRALDLEAWLNHPLEHLSGGQRQRAWLALALVQGSPLLLLDEPTSFLDPKHQRDLLDALWKLTRQSPVTVVAILHEPALARRYADSITEVSDLPS